jgi:hypothetical protein
MNSKIITHEMARIKLKELEKEQRRFKVARDYNFKYTTHEKAARFQKAIAENKREINVLLSIMYWHKMAKKYFFQLNEKK